MKKLMLLGTVLMGINSFAQNVEFGLKLGGVFNADKGVFTTAGGIYEDKGKGSVGFQAGGMARIKAGGIYIQPEVLYTSFKNEYDDGAGDSFEIGKRRLDIPVNIGKTFAAGLIQFQLGPVFSYYFDDDVSLDGLDQAEKDDFNMGFQIGTGLTLRNFVFDLRYEFGFGKTTSKFVHEEFGEFETENRSKLLNLSVGYFF